MKPRIIEVEEAVRSIKDGSIVCIGGGGAGHAVPERVLVELGTFFQKTGRPRELTIIHPCGIGDSATRGLSHIALPGLVKRAIGGFWGNSPKMIELAKQNQIEGYNLPQGVLSHLMRACAAGRPGVITTTGLHTFVDPRVEGGKINDRTTEALNEVIRLDGTDYLFYKAPRIDVAIIRGTSADKEGNLTFEEEVGSFAMLSMAQAARQNKGMVIAQVKRSLDRHADPGTVRVPGAFIDKIVIEPAQEMTFLSQFEPALVKRDTEYEDDDLSLEGIRRIVARRAAMELVDGAYVNVGYGLADGVPIVAREENVIDRLTFLIEQGSLGGIPTTGLNFGAMYNPSAILDDGYQFDFFHGGGLDIAFLGFAQIDQQGNVNSSRFGNQLTGCGGAIDISQNAETVVFCGSFAVKGQAEISEGSIRIVNPGKAKKFVRQVQQITFNGQYALEKGQQVLYVTERAVFKLTADGLHLLEVAPGVDVERDLLDMMEFRPVMPEEPKIMDSAVFSQAALNLPERLESQSSPT